jgi:hypothetical protein
MAAAAVAAAGKPSSSTAEPLPRGGVFSCQNSGRSPSRLIYGQTAVPLINKCGSVYVAPMIKNERLRRVAPMDSTHPPSQCNNAERGTHGGTHVASMLDTRLLMGGPMMLGLRQNDPSLPEVSHG